MSCRCVTGTSEPMTQPIKPADISSEVHRLRRAAWRHHGVAILDVDKIVDAILRVEVSDLCDGLYGKRISSCRKEEKPVET